MKKCYAKKRVSFPISFKMTIIVFVSLLLSTLLTGWLAYKTIKGELVLSLKNTLEGIVATAALHINGDAHGAITSPDDDIYKTVQFFLQKTKSANGLGAPLYTLKKSSGPNEVECVVTSEGVGLMGAVYKANDEIEAAFEKKRTTSTGLYETENGIWVSAYGPIKNAAGSVVAVLKAQRHAGYIREALSVRLLWIVLFCAIAFAAGLSLSVFLIRQITANVERLNESAAALEMGDYDSKIELQTDDEIGRLSQTLEKMRLSLKEHILKLNDMWSKEKKAHLESVFTLSKAIELRDPYARGHIERVSRYSAIIAKKIGIDDEKIEQLKYGCMLHDLGKLDIDIGILEKTAALDTEEKEIVKKHPVYGAEILKGIRFLDVAREITLYHHERHDGKGYPHGLKGDRIPILARIVALADSFDAMVSDRPYRRKMSVDEALAIIKSEAGRQFDPEICYIFFELKNEMAEVLEKYPAGPAQEKEA